MRQRGQRLLAIVILLGMTALVRADALDDLDKLDSIADSEYRNISKPQALDMPPFVHEKALRITAENLESPWIKNRQCHNHFPVFPSLQITFQADSVRAMRITHRENVEAAWIEGPSVQMLETRPESRLCFESENRVFHHDAKTDSYRLRVGPYFLRLFDGYFPLQVKLEISYPGDRLELIGMTPDPVEGAELKLSSGEIFFQNVFEGRLELEFIFRER